MILLRVLLCALLLLFALSACTRKPAEEQDKALTEFTPPAATPLSGGDARAWLGPLGDQADSNRCRARLKLPLAAQPVWTESYTSAEFSGAAPTTLLHFDGTVVVAARSSQLMTLDNESGKQIQNRDVFLRKAEATEYQEHLEQLFISPSGRLVANDNIGQIYCFDLPALNSIWSFHPDNAGRDGAGALVADARAVYTSWGTWGLKHLRALGLEDGGLLWTYPMSGTEDLPGVTYSRSGLVLCYADPNLIRAVRSSDGAGAWTVGAATEIQLAPIDAQRGSVHLVLANETVQCRRLEDGAPLWRYSWRELLADDERARLNRESGRAEATTEPLNLPYSAYCIGADATYLALLSGHIVRLGADGKAVWTTRLDSAVRSMVLFDNALLVSQLYLVPAIQHPEGSERPRFDNSDPFNLTRPAWKMAAPARDESVGELPQQQAWTRITALALDNGAILSIVEPETIALSNLCPAGGNVVYGGDLAGTGSRQRRHYITAYNWVEP